jgi:hypothetical protein
LHPEQGKRNLQLICESVFPTTWVMDFNVNKFIESSITKARREEIQCRSQTEAKVRPFLSAGWELELKSSSDEIQEAGYLSRDGNTMMFAFMMRDCGSHSTAWLGRGTVSRASMSPKIP